MGATMGAAVKLELQVLPPSVGLAAVTTLLTHAKRLFVVGELVAGHVQGRAHARRGWRRHCGASSSTGTPEQ
jgi:hypothetical protein